MKRIVASSILIVLIGWVIYDTINDEDEVEYQEPVNIEIKSISPDNHQQEKQEKQIEVGIDVGKLAPDFELQTPEGDMVKLSDYRGKPVILNFWATWCPPCIEEMPDLEQFYQENDVTVVGVNLTSREMGMQQIIDFKEEHDITFPILLDNANQVSKLYRIVPIPTTYFIDDKGIIRHHIAGQVDLETLKTELQHIERDS
ncbi:peroxiredoxin [Gracilibacillus halotolerans]|uniref:Peroxiredoxin n=1 Tax=Gracilibacillus halotolerans TaxID=74386 RepID=A0A841RKI3_9BACI|nr:TlpA disulfide reductase family protein [Gracilibacillus halotolerans]MBB6513009.1 peroxiredoxin [Gracilibacillus halotolerans]